MAQMDNDNASLIQTLLQVFSSIGEKAGGDPGLNIKHCPLARGK